MLLQTKSYIPNNIVLQGFCSSTSHQMGTFAGFLMLSTRKQNAIVKAKNFFIKRELS